MAALCSHYNATTAAFEAVITSQANRPFEEGVLLIDLPKSISDTMSQMAALASAEANVVLDPEMRGGLPVMRGTRVGVYEIAGLTKQESVEEIFAKFPSLTVSHLKQATLYANAHPLKQR